MKLLPLTILCPTCESTDVVYSCHPDCCFNHICSDCLSNFELHTRDLGKDAAFVEIEPAAKDSFAPTVACARCESLLVYQLADRPPPENIVCASCHALLELAFAPD